ncbi:hypothetical protein Tco_1254914, partial [Tanacetum coccineum]
IPEFESFYFDDPSFPRPPPEPPDVEICLHFKPDAPVIDNFNELNDDQEGDSPLLLSTGSEDTIFDPGTDIKEIDIIKAKTDKAEHENGYSAQEPEVF